MSETTSSATAGGIDQEGSTARTEAPAIESHEARLTRLRTTGFRKLRDGRIHVRCYSCGRKVSNTVRMEYDPPAATLIETPCERCSQGCKEPESFYYDATGTEVEVPDSYEAEDDGECCCKPDGCTLDCDYRREMMHPERAPALAVDPSWSTPDEAVTDAVR